MSLKEEDRRILVELELEKAEKTFSQVEALKREQYWDTLANRLYYSLFHAVSALLINDQREVGSHKGAAIHVTETDIVSKIAPTSSFIEKVKQYVTEQK